MPDQERNHLNELRGRNILSVPNYHLVSRPQTLYKSCTEYQYHAIPSLYDYSILNSIVFMDGKYLVLNTEEQDEFFNEDESGLEELI